MWIICSKMLLMWSLSWDIHFGISWSNIFQDIICTWNVLTAKFNFFPCRQAAGQSSPLSESTSNHTLTAEGLWAAKSWRGEVVVLRIFFIMEEKWTLKWRIPFRRSWPSLPTLFTLSQVKTGECPAVPVTKSYSAGSLPPPSLWRLSVSIPAPCLH